MIKVQPRTKEIFCDCCGKRIAFKSSIFSRLTLDKATGFIEYRYTDARGKQYKVHICAYCNVCMFQTIEKKVKEQNNETQNTKR